MRMIKIQIANKDHVALMAGNMRQCDQDECRAVSGASAEEALRRGLYESSVCWALTIEGMPFMIGGVAPKGSLTEGGTPWALGTDVVKTEEGAYALNRIVGDCLNEMLDAYGYLENYVDARNHVSIKWLKRCGFKFGKAKIYGVEKRPFYRFYMTREDNNV